MKKSYFSLLIMLCLSGHYSQAQETENSVSNVQNIPSKYYSSIQKKFSSINENLRKKSIKYLEKLQRQETKMERKLSKIDSLSAHNLFVSSQQQYAGLIRKVNTDSASSTGKVNGEYLPYLDSIKGSLSFLQQDKTTSTLLKDGDVSKISSALTEVNQFQNKLQNAEAIKQFIKERKQQITDVLSRYTALPNGIKNVFTSYKKQAYYYSAQVQEYENMLKDPKKIEQKTLSILSRLPIFQKFMSQNSQLASLFQPPGGMGSVQNLTGLQTRSSVQALIQQSIASGSPNAQAQVRANLAEAQAEIGKLKDKLNQFTGGSSGNVDMPDFTPNTQKTKSLLQRLEYSADLQFDKSNKLLPSTANIGLGIGYKLNDKSAVGIGLSYKIGMGTLQHISFTSQGLGLRSYMDWRIKKQIYITGGYESNYNSVFKDIQQLKKYDAWQTSALMGISRKYKVSKKVQGEMKLLYDFLANTHVPVTQPLVFRLGYKF